MNKLLTNVASYFHFKDRSATFKKEIIGGLSTFMAMAYILAVNPSMLSNANGAEGYAGVFFLGTAITSMLGTLIMGLYAKVPVALAPGMGVNAFFAYTVAGTVLNLQIEQALVATLCSGVLYVIIAITPARLYIAKLLPKNIKLAIGAMIGLFLAYVGLSNSGIIVSGASSPEWLAGAGLKNSVLIATNTKLGNLADPFVIIAIVTLLLVFVLHFLKVPGAAVIAMLAAIVMIAIAYGAKVNDAAKAFSLQGYADFGKFGQLSTKMFQSFGSTLANGKVYIAIFVFLYIDFFDTTGTLFSIGEQAKLNPKKGEVIKRNDWMQKANVVDAASTIVGSLMLTSTATTYVESSVGVSQGARTGFASIVTGALFALSIAIWPIMTPLMPISHSVNGMAIANQSVMPVTGPILVMVGALMIAQIKHFNWKQSIDIPMLFVTLILGTLSYSISTGIAAGFIVYYVMNLTTYVVMLVRKKPINLEDEEFVLATDIEPVTNSLPDLKRRVLNPMAITLCLLAITYFATMPLYAF